MHRLYLLRHAEASRGTPGIADFERPLTERGKQDAAALGLRMRAQGHLPSLVLCSSAKRARETFHAVSAGLAPAAAEPLYLRELYRGGASDYLLLVAAMAGQGPMLVIGHNPMVEELAGTLTRDGEPEAMAALAAGFPVGGLAVIDFVEPLQRIAPRKGRLVAFFSRQS